MLLSKFWHIKNVIAVVELDSEHDHSRVDHPELHETGYPAIHASLKIVPKEESLQLNALTIRIAEQESQSIGELLKYQPVNDYVIKLTIKPECP